MRLPIIEVWGNADSYPLTFTPEEGIKWKVQVPPDLHDGAYECSIGAKNEAGEMGFWAGWLYMCNGICHLELRPQQYRIIYEPSETCRLVFALPEESGYRIIFERKCGHVL